MGFAGALATAIDKLLEYGRRIGVITRILGRCRVAARGRAPFRSPSFCRRPAFQSRSSFRSARRSTEPVGTAEPLFAATATAKLSAAPGFTLALLAESAVVVVLFAAADTVIATGGETDAL